MIGQPFRSPISSTHPTNSLALRWSTDLLGLLAFAVLLWSLAYQFPLALTLHVGGDLALTRRYDEEPFLRGANGSEPAERVDTPSDPRGYVWWWEELARTGERPYRWLSGDAAVVVPGAGGGPYLVELLARSGRPDGSTASSTWIDSTGRSLQVALAAGEPRRYQLLVAPGSDGTVRIEMRTPIFAAPGDPRELGFVLHEVRLHDLGAAPRLPAWPSLALLLVVVGAVYTTVTVLGIGRGAALVGAAGTVLAAALTLAVARPALTTFAPALALLAASCAALGIAALPLARRLAPAAALPGEAGLVVALTLLAFALRMAGLLHPQARFSDLGLHANNLFEITLGQPFFTEGLPGSAGGGRSPYPPGNYLLLLPGQLFAPGFEARRLLVQSGASLLDSLTLIVIWVLLRRAGFGRAGAAFGAACYLLPPPILESLSIGEYANVSGQALALPLLALLGLGLVQPRQPLVTLTAAIALALLAHSGVTLSVGALVASAWAAAWVLRLRRTPTPSDPVRLTVGAALGLAVVLLIFYTAPQFLAVLGERSGGGSGRPIGSVLGDTVRALLGLAPPQDTRVAMPPMFGLFGLGGLALLVARRTADATALRMLLVAWWAGAVLSLGLLVVAGQGVRWASFLYPALCIGAGICLGLLWQRGTPGRLAALTVLAGVLGYGLFVWIVQIRDFIHI